MNIAIIPARGGSKRIPRKNIKDFFGKPMIAWSIETAKASGLFEHIVVTTDDAEVSETAKTWGAEVPFIRPAELADDYTTTVPIIAHAIGACRNLGWQVDQVCCIYPTAPFMQSTDLVTALHILETTDVDYAFPVAAYTSAIQRALRKRADGLMESFDNQYNSTRSQDLEPAYYDVGQFYWGRAQAWLDGKTVRNHGIGLVIPNWRVVDIDNAEDWHRAELMYAAFNNANRSITKVF